MSRAALLGSLLMGLPAVVHAQSDSSRPSTVTLYGSVGFVHNFSTFDVEVPGLDRNGAGAQIRIMWQPGQLLSAGLEFGRTHVYSVTRPVPSGGEVYQTLDAWPILAVFGMSPAKRLTVNVGTGFASNTSSVTLLDSRASSSALGAAYMASAMYLVPLSPQFSLGGEVRYLRLAKYEDNNLSLQVTLAWLLRNR
jgi:hypothetical protein